MAISKINSILRFGRVSCRVVSFVSNGKTRKRTSTKVATCDNDDLFGWRKKTSTSERKKERSRARSLNTSMIDRTAARIRALAVYCMSVVYKINVKHASIVQRPWYILNEDLFHESFTQINLERTLFCFSVLFRHFADLHRTSEQIVSDPFFFCDCL